MDTFPRVRVHEISWGHYSHVFQASLADPEHELPPIRLYVRQVLGGKSTTTFQTVNEVRWIDSYRSNRHAFAVIESDAIEVSRKLQELQVDPVNFSLTVERLVGRAGFFVIVRAAHTKYMPAALNALRQIYRYVDVYEVST